jgi:hypothetical protein
MFEFNEFVDQMSALYSETIHSANSPASASVLSGWR